MNNIKEKLKERGIHPKGYEYRNNVIIIDTDDNKYVIKKNVNNYDVYNYLNTRGFNNYPTNYTNESDNYDLSLYIEDKIIPKEQKIEELIKTLSFLHYKTSYSYESDLDDIKKTYEDIKNDLVNLLNYYNELNNYLDTQTFLSPSEYLLIRNISLIYSMIDYGIKKIDIWYKLATECKKCRTCLIHNNISSDHLIVNDYNYLVSWDRSKIDKPIMDLLSFYKNYYSYLKLDDVFKLYENNNCLYEEEKCLLLIYLSIPNKLVFTNNVMDDVIKINSEITYLNKVYEYIRNNR